MQACSAGYALTYLVTLKLQLVSQSQGYIATYGQPTSLSWC
jgi:hypothetical protein